MSSARAALVIAVLAVLGACGSSRPSQMFPAGSDKDDGYGDLAQKSARLLTSDGSDAPLFTAHRHRPRSDGGPYGGEPYGGDLDDGDEVPDLQQQPPPCRGCGVNPLPPPRLSDYTAVPGLTGAIEGTITWRGAPPAPVVTPCGPIANPSVRVAANRTVGGVLVYIEHVEVGRRLPHYGRPLTVGGTIAKRGCVLTPTLQIVTPLPAAVAIHGDAADTKLRVTLPSQVKLFDLQQAGRVVIQAERGVTRIEADDSSLGVAWIVAADTPYYAITDDSGRFRIDELAAGTYDLTFWRPPIAAITDGKLAYGPPAVTRRTIKVDPTRRARLDIALER